MTKSSSRRRRLATYDGQLPTNWREQMDQQEQSKRSIDLSPEYRAAQTAADKMPALPRVQTPFNVSHGVLHMLRTIAREEGTSVQALLREAVDKLVAERTRTTARGSKKKKTRTRKSSRRATDSGE